MANEKVPITSGQKDFIQKVFGVNVKEVYGFDEAKALLGEYVTNDKPTINEETGVPDKKEFNRWIMAKRQELLAIDGVEDTKIEKRKEYEELWEKAKTAASIAESDFAHHCEIHVEPANNGMVQLWKELGLGYPDAEKGWNLPFILDNPEKSVEAANAIVKTLKEMEVKAVVRVLSVDDR